MNDYQDLTDCPICPQLATDRDDALREAEALRAELTGKSAALQALASERRSCTPAERALIYAAVAWRRAMRDCRDRRPNERYATWAEVNDAMCAAADAVLAERGES